MTGDILSVTFILEPGAMLPVVETAALPNTSMSLTGAVHGGPASVVEAGLQAGDVRALHRRQAEVSSSGSAVMRGGAFAAILGYGAVATWGWR